MTGKGKSKLPLPGIPCAPGDHPRANLNTGMPRAVLRQSRLPNSASD